MQQNNFDRTIKNINTFFIAAFVEVIIIAAVGIMLSDKISFWDPLSIKAVNLSSVYILYTIATVPLSFYFFNKKSKKWVKIDDEKEKMRLYERDSIARLLVVSSSAFLGSIIYFFLINTSSIIFCIAISLVSLFFCRSNEARIHQELELQISSEETNEQNDKDELINSDETNKK